MVYELVYKNNNFVPLILNGRLRHCTHLSLGLFNRVEFWKVAMSMEEASKKSSYPQLMTLNRALKLAENWVNGMSGSLGDSKSTEVVLEGRAARLGIGAAVPRESKVLNSNDPVKRKLYAKLIADKRKALKNTEESVLSTQNASIKEDSDEELESRSQAFTKKRPMNMGAPLLTKKKRK